MKLPNVPKPTTYVVYVSKISVPEGKEITSQNAVRLGQFSESIAAIGLRLLLLALLRSNTNNIS